MPGSPRRSTATSPGRATVRRRDSGRAASASSPPTTGIGLVLLPTGLASVVGGVVGGPVVERYGPRALVAAGALLGIAGHAWLALADTSPAALSVGSAFVGLAWVLDPDRHRVGRHPQCAPRQHERRGCRQRCDAQHRVRDRRAGRVRDCRGPRRGWGIPGRVRLHLGLCDGRPRSALLLPASTPMPARIGHATAAEAGTVAVTGVRARESRR